MPYTNAWSDNIPLGTAPANTIDDQIRQLRLDIHERMDMIVVDWEADPVVPLAAAGLPAFGVGYDDTLAAGSKALNDITVAAYLTLKYRGTAVNFNYTINLNEVNTLTGATWQVANIYNPIAGTVNLPLSFTGRRSGDEALGIRRLVLDTVANTVQVILGLENMTTFPTVVDTTMTLAFTAL